MSEKTIEMNIKGMTCPKCSGRVKKALEGSEGVISAEVDHMSGKAVLRVEEGGYDLPALKKAVMEAGYQTD